MQIRIHPERWHLFHAEPNSRPPGSVKASPWKFWKRIPFLVAHAWQKVEQSGSSFTLPPDDSTRAAFTDKLEDLAVVWQSLNAFEVTPATCHSYKVDVILATGNERGSDAATVTRP